jgi:hypothetical protein
MGTLASIRLQVLKNTEAMLIQKKLSILRGITLVYRDDVPRGPVSSEEQAAADKDLAQAKRDLEDAQAEADRYSGGLLANLAQLRVAVASMVVGLVVQQRTLHRYGISTPSVVHSDSKPGTPPGQIVPDKSAL